MTPERPLIIQAGDELASAVTVIRTGGIIAYPTETFYGLGVDPANPGALKRLFELKGRPTDRAMPLIAGSMADVKTVTREISPLGERLIKSFWPGPLTLIFEAADNTPRLITGGGNGVGIRISDYPLCKRLTSLLGHTITSTSANPTGHLPALDAIEVKEYFKGKIDLILDGGRLAGGMASTVVDTRGEIPLILREGAVKKAAILKAIGDGD